MNVTREQVESGQAVYTTRVLKLYDFVVLGVSNRFIWKCPTPRQLQHYQQHLSANHLDVGVGSGYFLDRCRFPTKSPRVALLDLNPTALEFAAQRIARYRPRAIAATFSNPSRSSARLRLRGGQLSTALPAGLTGIEGRGIRPPAAIDEGQCQVVRYDAVASGVVRGWSARRLMAVYNKQGHLLEPAG